MILACGDSGGTPTRTDTRVTPESTAAPATPTHAAPQIGVFVVRGDGSALRRVSDEDAFSQAWSPDSTQLAFVNRVSQGHELTLLNVASGATRQFGETRPATLAFSPNGQQLLVTAPTAPGAAPETPSVLEVIDVDTGQRRRIADAIGGEWAPDGSRVAVAGTNCDARFVRVIVDLATGKTSDLLSKHPGASTFASRDWSRAAYFKFGGPFLDDPQVDNPLFVANLDGTDERALPTAGIGRAIPSWSPDGRWIAYASRSKGVYTPYVLRADGSGAPIKLAEGGETDEWSPDSSTILLRTGTNGADASKIENVIYEVSSAKTRSLQSGPLWAAQWSPTGKQLVFVAPTATGSTALFLYDVASGGTTQVTDASISPAIPRWSPDGKQIAFLGIPGGYDYGPCL